MNKLIIGGAFVIGAIAYLVLRKKDDGRMSIVQRAEMVPMTGRDTPETAPGSVVAISPQAAQSMSSVLARTVVSPAHPKTKPKTPVAYRKTMSATARTEPAEPTEPAERTGSRSSSVNTYYRAGTRL